MNHTEIRVPMRDGVRLHAKLFQPDGAGPFPTVYAQSIYDAAHQEGRVAGWLAAGYAVVLQSTRGRLGSEGQLCGGALTPQDGYDTLEWLTRQSWCDGRVGTFGPSALAAAQVQMAFLAHPAHQAMAPQVLAFDLMRPYGGAYLFAQIAQWLVHTQSGRNLVPFESVEWMPRLNRLPVVDALTGLGPAEQVYRRVVTNPHHNYFPGGEPAQFARLRTPALLATGWFDHCSNGALDFYRLVQQHASPFQRENTHLIIGPWEHMCSPTEITEYDFGPHAPRDLSRDEAVFFERHVKQNAAAPKLPPVQIFVMGRNAWRTEPEWPLARAVPTRFYLHRSGALNPRAPGDEAPDRFTYDPGNPVPTVGGANNYPARFLPMKVGPRDQRSVLHRDDVLVFTSEPVQTPLEITGPLKLVLYAASTACDTDFTGKLMVVRPDGNAMLLTDGIVRARYRHGRTTTPSFLTSGQVEEYTIDLQQISYEFQPGERIGLAISSSNFPRFSRNLNTGGDNERDTAFIQAEQTIYHDATRPSHLVLPVVPAS